MAKVVAAADGNGDNEPAKSKRKLTDARREQNRQSQRTWREKQKKRRAEEAEVKIHAVLKRRVDGNGFRPLPRTAASDGSPATPASEDFKSAPRVQSRRFEHDQDPSMAMDLPPDPSMVIPEPELTLPVAVYYYVPPDPNAPDMRHFWPVPDDTLYKTYVLPPERIPPRFESPASHNSGPGTFARRTPPHHLSSPLSPSWPPSPATWAWSATPGTVLPSPYLNHLQLVGESCFAATLSIAQCLGISRSSYVNDHHSPFSVSSSATIHAMPPDLQPTAFQIILPHPCYLDCIPFPHFRSMAIYLSSVNKLDHCSLFLDLMHDGMVCWGREHADSRHGRSMRDGVAWSRRSWEVRKWFWRKWSWIARMRADDLDADPLLHDPHPDLDDKDGMLTGSQWWWSLHDDGPLSPTSGPVANLKVLLDAPGNEELGMLLARHVTCNVGIRNIKNVIAWD